MTKFDPNAVYDPKAIESHDYMCDVLGKNRFIDKKELKDRQEAGVANIYFDSTGVKTKDKGSDNIPVLDANDTIYLRTGEKELVALTAQEFITDNRFFPNKSPSEKLALLQTASKHKIYGGRDYGGRPLPIDPEFQKFVNSLMPTQDITHKAVNGFTLGAQLVAKENAANPKLHTDPGTIGKWMHDAIVTGGVMSHFENSDASPHEIGKYYEKLNQEYIKNSQPEGLQVLIHAVRGVLSYIFPGINK